MFDITKPLDVFALVAFGGFLFTLYPMGWRRRRDNAKRVELNVGSSRVPLAKAPAQFGKTGAKGSGKTPGKAAGKTAGNTPGGKAPARAAAGGAAGKAGKPAGKPNQIDSATLNAFRNMYINQSEIEKEGIIKYWMNLHGCSRGQAMAHAIQQQEMSMDDGADPQ